MAQVRQILLELGLRYFRRNDDVQRRSAFSLGAGVEDLPAAFVLRRYDDPSEQVEFYRGHGFCALINCPVWLRIASLTAIAKFVDSLPFRLTAIVVGIRNRFYGSNA